MTALAEVPEQTRPATGSLVRTGAVAGMVAALATTAIAALATAADVPLEVDGAAIPVAAFAWWTIIGAVLGTGLARVLGRRRRFLAVATGLTAVSLVPPFAADDIATTVVLVLAHLVAAVVIVGALARRL